MKKILFIISFLISSILQGSQNNVFGFGKQGMNILFLKAVEKLEINVVRGILKSPRFKDISNWTFVEALVKSMKKGGSSDITRMLIKNSRFKELSVKDLDFLMFKASQTGNKEIVQIIVNDPRCIENDFDYLSDALSKASKNGYEEIVQILLDRFNYKKRKSGLFVALLDAIKNDHQKIIQLFINDPKVQIFIKSQKFNESLSYWITQILETAAQYGDEEIIKIFINSPQFKETNYLKYSLGNVLSRAVENGHIGVVKIIMDNPEFKKIDLYQLYRILVIAIQEHHDDIIKLLKFSTQFKDASSYELGFALRMAARYKEEEVVQMIIDDPRFLEISNDELAIAFKDAVADNNENIVKKFIYDKRFQDISYQDLEQALNLCATHGYEKILRIILKESGLHIREIALREALANAVQGKHEGCIHLLKAYTAFKPGINVNKLTEIDKKFYLAYQQFLEGKSNNLHNLIFPIGKKVDSLEGTTSYIYAIYPQQNAESAAMNIISKSLVKLFKPDCIRSLILTLVETNADKYIAADFLEQIGISKKDITATKIQSAFRNYTARKRVEEERAKEEEKESETSNDFAKQRAEAY